jgi:hypothetical protein
MKDEIQQKLRDHVDGPLSEAVVTYILVKVRELIDFKRAPLKDNDPEVTELNFLKTYCDWTVHHEMDFNGRTKRFLKAIDDYVRENGANAGVPNPYQGEMEELYYLEDFRSRLSTFLKGEQIPNTVAEDRTRWVRFLTHYAAIIHNYGNMQSDFSGV